MHSSTSAVASPLLAPRPPLERDRECVVSGVSAGLARHLGVRVGIIRTMFIALSLFAGAGALLYLWLWAFVPWQAGEGAPSRRAPVAWILIAAAGVASLVVIADSGYPYMLSHVFVGGSVRAVVSLPLAVVAATAAGVWATLIDRADPERGPRQTLIVRLVSVALLVILFFTVSARTHEPTVLLPVVGAAVVVLSMFVPYWRDLSGERVRRIREEQRSEMAAHLHDSVLQTLALIQNRAGASSEAARLARAQERELRAWLYDGDSPADGDLSSDLRDYAAALEIDYPVRIDVVSAGLSTERASGEIASAAREAMLNAARHAGGEVSVYIEGGSSGVDVFIRDRGDGFVLDDVPADRLGVRESVIGRMRRSGGTAVVRSDENGTEVHLRATGEKHD